MSTKAIEQKLNSLDRELTMLKSVLMGTLAERDPEGEYRPEFVKRMLALSKKKRAGVLFTSPEAFLKKIS